MPKYMNEAAVRRVKFAPVVLISKTQLMAYFLATFAVASIWEQLIGVSSKLTFSYTLLLGHGIILKSSSLEEPVFKALYIFVALCPDFRTLSLHILQVMQAASCKLQATIAGSKRVH